MSQQRKNRDRGKRHERAIAKLFDGRRIGILGKHDVEDGEGRFSIECKSKEEFPKWFRRMIAQTLTNCQEGTVPLLVLHKLKTKYKDDWVVIRMEDFLEILKERESE